MGAASGVVERPLLDTILRDVACTFEYGRDFPKMVEGFWRLRNELLVRGLMCIQFVKVCEKEYTLLYLRSLD